MAARWLPFIVGETKRPNEREEHPISEHGAVARLQAGIAFFAEFLTTWLRVVWEGWRQLVLGDPSAPEAVSADPEEEAERAPDEVAFTLGVIALAARLITVDGPETRIEYQSFRANFPMPESEQGKIRKLYLAALGDKTSAPFYARHVMSLYPEKPALYRELMERLIRVAAVDGPVNLSELRMLRELAGVFEISDTALQRMGRAHLINSDQQAVELLGVARAKHPKEIKANYHRLLQLYHPDRLARHRADAADAFEAEWIDLLSEQAMTLTAAYQQMLARA